MALRWHVAGCCLLGLSLCAAGARAQSAPAQAPAGSAPQAPPGPIAPVAGEPAPVAPVPALPSEGAEQSAPAKKPAPSQGEAAAGMPAAEQPSAAPVAGSPDASSTPQPTAGSPAPALAPTAPPGTEPTPALTGTPESGAAATADGSASESERVRLGSLRPAGALGNQPGATRSDVPWFASITWGQSYYASGLVRSSDLTWNPTYTWDFLLAGGWQPDELTTLQLRQPLTVELTDSDSENPNGVVTNTRQELWLLDPSLKLSRQLWSHEPAAGHELAVIGAAALVLPLSKYSQAVHRILGTQAGASLEYESSRLLEGFAAGVSLAYLRYWSGSSVVHLDSATPCVPGSSEIAQNCSYLGGSTATRDLMVLALHGELSPLPKLSLGAALAFAFRRAYGLDSTDIAIESGETLHVGDNSTTHFRNTREITFSVTYAVTDWFSAAAKVVNGFNERGPDGELRGPFHAIDTALGLDLSISIDQLYATYGAHPAARD